MGRPNYSQAKRQREIDKKKKQEAKRAQKAAAHAEKVQADGAPAPESPPPEA